MDIPRWTPSQTVSRQEQYLLSRLKRTRKLFAFLLRSPVKPAPGIPFVRLSLLLPFVLVGAMNTSPRSEPRRAGR